MAKRKSVNRKVCPRCGARAPLYGKPDKPAKLYVLGNRKALTLVAKCKKCGYEAYEWLLHIEKK